LFEDIGIILSEKSKKEIIDYEPRFTVLSVVPYDAPKASREKQTITLI
jgi:hypothetical protein